jgi:hypothetical protein
MTSPTGIYLGVKMSKVKILIEKMDKNQVRLSNSESWQELMNATKINIDDMNKVSKELGYSSFQAMNITTNAGDLYKQDSQRVIDAFNRTMDITKIKDSDIENQFNKIAKKLGIDKTESLDKVSKALELLNG